MHADFIRRLTRRLPRIALLGLVLMGASWAHAQPAFDQRFIPDEIGPGGISLLTFTIGNRAASAPALDAAFSATLPAGLVLATPANPFTNCVDGVLSAPDGGGTITFSNGRLAAGEQCEVSVLVTTNISSPQTFMSVSGDLTSSLGNSGNSSADLQLDLVRPAFSKSFSPSVIPFGGRSTLTFLIDNSINSENSTSLTFEDVFPTGLVVADPANASVDCTGGSLIAIPGADRISYRPQFPGDASLTAGASCAITVDVVSSINLGGVEPLINVSSELTSNNPFFPVSSGFATAALEPSVSDRVILVQEFLGDSVLPGSTVDVRFTVQNLDRDSALVNGAFTSDLDAMVAGLVATGLPANDVCGPGSTVSGTSLLSLTGANLAPEASCSFVVSLQVPAAATLGGFLSTTTGLSGEINAFPVLSTPPRDVLFIDDAPVLSKVFLTNPIGSGDVTTMEFTIFNPSVTTTFTEIGFQDDLGAFIESTQVVALPPSGFCGPGSFVTTTLLPTSTGLVISGASLAPGASCTFSIDLQIPLTASSQTATNITSVLSSRDGSRIATTASAVADLTVVGAPRLTKEFDVTTAAAGDVINLEFSISHAESAPADATAISFTDDLNAMLGGLTAIGLPLNDVCGAGSSLTGTTNLSFTGGTLAPGQTCNFSVPLQVPAAAFPGQYVNTSSTLTALVAGLITQSPATAASLLISGLELSLSFVDDPALPGGSVELEYTIDNSGQFDATGIFFTHSMTATLSGLTAITLPPPDFCGPGSNLSGTTFLILTGGTLGPGESCTFSVTLAVPGGANEASYNSVTSSLTATLNGTTIVLPPASDALDIVASRLFLQHEFTNDPVQPGGAVTLEYTLENLDVLNPVTAISFSHALDDVFPGVSAVALPANDVCGVGSTISGAGIVTLSGGGLAPGASCVFSIDVLVPAGIPAGTYPSQTSVVDGTIGGLPVTGPVSEDLLGVQSIEFSKIFVNSPLDIGSGPAVASLQFEIINNGPSTAVDIAFSDDLDAVLSGLSAINLPLTGVCGAGSVLAGTSVISLSGASLPPFAACVFSVDVQTPAGATGGTYSNITSDLTAVGLSVASPAITDLVLVGAPLVNLVPATIDFGNQLLGTTSADSSSTLQNAGNDVLSVLSIDAATGDFGLSASSCPPTPFDLPPGGSCTLAYQFSPGAVGPSSQSLAVTSNAGSSPDALVLQGNGIQPGLSIAPSALAFGDTEVNTTSSALSVSLASSGTATVTITSVSAPTGDFTVAGGDCPATPFTLTPSSSCSISYAFSPTATGPASSTIDVVSDAPTSGSDSFDLTGNGTEAILVLGAASLSFPNTDVDDPAATIDLLLSNTGDAELAITSISDPLAPFSVDTGTRGGADCGSLPITLAPSSSCTVVVVFDPIVAGAFSSSIDLASNSVTSPDTVLLSGTGTQPVLTLSASTLAFADTAVGATATQSISLTNDGNGELIVDLADAPGTPFSLLFGTCGSAVSLAPTESCTIDIEFAPDAPADFAGSFDIPSNAPSAPDTVTLSGRGLQGILSLDATNLSFPVTEIGESTSLNVLLSNTGNLLLTVTALDGPNAPFVISGGSCGAVPFDLDAAATCSLTISFEPISPGRFDDTIDVVHTGANSPVTISLFGPVQAFPVPTLNTAMLLLMAALMLLVAGLGRPRQG